VTSDGNNINDFPENQLPNFVQYLEKSCFEQKNADLQDFSK